MPPSGFWRHPMRFVHACWFLDCTTWCLSPHTADSIWIGHDVGSFIYRFWLVYCSTSIHVTSIAFMLLSLHRNRWRFRACTSSYQEAKQMGSRFWNLNECTPKSFLLGLLPDAFRVLPTEDSSVGGHRHQQVRHTFMAWLGVFLFLSHRF